MVLTRTNERVFNRAALVMAPQTAQGSPVLDFTAGTGAMVWARMVRASENQQFESFQGTHGSIQERTDGFISTFNRPEIEVQFYPTPAMITEFLKSFAGPFAGTAVTWPDNITTFFSVLYAEAEDGASPAQKTFRFEDAWVRELEFEVGGLGVAVCRARIIAQKVSPFDTDAAGLVYASAPNDFQQFAHRAAEFIRDPAGANVTLAMSMLRLNLAHGFRHEPFNGENALILKEGFLEVTGNLTSRFMDETHAIRTDAVDDTLLPFRERLLGGGKELRFDLNNVKWTPADLGFEARSMLDFVADFRSGTTDPAVENAIDINVI